MSSIILLTSSSEIDVLTFVGFVGSRAMRLELSTKSYVIFTSHQHHHTTASSSDMEENKVRTKENLRTFRLLLMLET